MIKNKIKSIFSIEQITNLFRNDLVSKSKDNRVEQKKIKRESQYGKMLRESKKIMMFYGNISNRYLKKTFLKANAFRAENIFSILESRLDVVLYRASFFESIASAKQMIRVGGVTVNHIKVISPSYIVTPGDIVSISGKENRKMVFNKLQANPLRKFTGGKPRFLTEIDSKSISTLKIFDSTSNYLSCLHTRLIKLLLFSTKTIFSEKALKSEMVKKLTTKNIRELAAAGSAKPRREFANVNRMKNSLTSGFTPHSLLSSRQDKIFRKQKFFDAFTTLIYVITTKKKVVLFAYLKKVYKRLRRNEASLKVKLLQSQNKNVVAFFTKKDVVGNIVSENFIFFKYLLYLKKYFVWGTFFSLPKIKPKKEKLSFEKAHNLEISYQSLSIIFLFPPQRICFPNLINFSLICK